MSSATSVQLTEEQEKFLSSLEEEFKDRYTENDEEFKKVLNERLPLPPIVENWGDFRNRDERYDSYRPRYNRYHDRDGDYDRDRDRDRYRHGRRYDPYSQNDGRRYEPYSRDDGRRYEPYSRDDGRRYEHYSRDDGRRYEPYSRDDGGSYSHSLARPRAS